VERFVRVTCYEDLRTLRATCPPELGTLNVFRTGRSPDRFEVKLELAPRQPGSEFHSDVVLIGTLENGEELPAIPVPVQGRFMPAVRVMPAEIVFPPSLVAETQSATAVLQSTARQHCEIENAWFEKPGLSVSLTEHEQRAGHTIEVRSFLDSPGLHLNTLHLVVRLQGKSLHRVDVPVQDYRLQATR